MTRTMRAALGDTVLDLALRRHRAQLWGELTEQCADPAATQAATLAEILSRNATTTFGRAHGFASIAGPSEFARAVPVHDYEALRPSIERQETTRETMLTAEHPVMYALTSGTTGQPKLVPVTPTGLARQTKAQRLLATMSHAGSAVFSGRILGIGGPAVEGRRPSGAPYGSASGMIFESMPRFVRSRYLLPSSVLSVSDHDARAYAIAVLALSSADLTGIGTANPSTMLRLREVIVERWVDLLDDIASSTINGAALDPEPRRAVEAALVGARDRAAQLRSIVDDPSSLRLGRLWPGLALVTTWTRGSCGLALSRLRDELDPGTPIVDLGYSASEIRGTVPVDLESGRCVPTIGDNYFEFVERDAWEEGSADFLTLSDVEPGREYYVFITTLDGLYRYDMNDIVEVTGMFGATPCLGFVQKGRGVTSITGEKLHESQVLRAVVDAGAGRVLGSGFFLMLADTPGARYHLYLEGPLDPDELMRVGRAVDETLSRLNIEYRAKRASGRLAPVTTSELRPGTGEAYRRHCLDRGQREAQLKILHLQRAEDCGFDLAAASTGRAVTTPSVDR
jgi:GH3 auxin-responsive promoter